MKKISLLSLAVFAGLIVLAQEPKLKTDMAVQPRFGLRAGVNLATLEIDDDSQSNINTNNKTTFHGGVFVNIPVGGMFRFQPELSYSRQGSKVDYPDVPTGTVNTEWDFDYINLPLMLQWQSTGGFFVELGPQIGFLLKAEDEESGEDIKDDLKKIDFGANAGIGYLSRIGLGINARYDYGFSNIFDDDNTSGDFKLRNRVIQLGLVYHFGANK
ncbi:MAG: PorT family protein [Chitinophagaceae bacterium]|nr:PorT family protein [Chitinophagaceae bacterium]